MYLSIEEINKLVKEYEEDTKAIKEELFTLCWYMRGGVTVSESYLLTYEDRKLINKLIEKNLEVTKESGLPFF